MSARSIRLTNKKRLRHPRTRIQTQAMAQKATDHIETHLGGTGDEMYCLR
ncbi:hypothetical protein LOCC1_G003647 [Lachnellula occidentalis]|uniref:Uncharacterized protein n=1 Tax=Lachnellula occidentalis TaxID=215460 RepID=A0A8H8S0N1_9HELO|nr:hypothetical protein LOCC1_G003647 [Lachnellula occidentalis]